MSRKHLVRSVIRSLEERGYQFLSFLGSGGFADVIAVINPAGQKVAVKIVHKSNVWPIEDEYWPTFQHPNILPVISVMTIEELEVRLYFMPLLSDAMDKIVRSDEFKKDPKSFHRIKKWFLQIISAIDHLHSRRMCHLDIKSDNILIDEEDNALLADFSGLNFTIFPINRIVAPDVFQAPECFSSEDGHIQGASFDMWSYGLLVLNILTKDYFNKKICRFLDNVNWNEGIRPVVEKALKDGKFKKLLKKAFSKCNLSPTDVQEALDFVKFIMAIKPEDRPSAARVKSHAFLQPQRLSTETYSFMEMEGAGAPCEEQPPSPEIERVREDPAHLLEEEPIIISIEPFLIEVLPRRRTKKALAKKWLLRKIKNVFNRPFIE